METATISQVKNRLSAYLRKVRAGQTLLILDRDQPVAVLRGVDADTDPIGALSRLEQRGLLRRSATASPLQALADPIESAAGVVEALVAERRGGR